MHKLFEGALVWFEPCFKMTLFLILFLQKNTTPVAPDTDSSGTMSYIVPMLIILLIAIGVAIYLNYS